MIGQKRAIPNTPSIGLANVTEVLLLVRSPAFIVVLGEIAPAYVTIAASNRVKRNGSLQLILSATPKCRRGAYETATPALRGCPGPDPGQR